MKHAPLAERAAERLAYQVRSVWHSEGHRLFIVTTNWAAGVGARDTLDVLAAQLREAGADVTPAAISMLLNRRRMPSLMLAGAIERAFLGGIPAGAWSVAPTGAFPSGASRAVNRVPSTSRSTDTNLGESTAASVAAE